MKGPRCKICFQEHWSHESHKFKEPVERDREVLEKLDVISNKRNVGQVQANRRWRAKNKDKVSETNKRYYQKRKKQIG